jgi:hypothetical protein
MQLDPAPWPGEPFPHELGMMIARVGRFLWPSVANGAVTISTAQMAYLLDGIDRRRPQHTWQPEVAG